uniref:Uncharacterized protein n=1 Tax=Ditylenchus dipsaci TaxID=166011 RepID=A0A915EDB0_9BILA
MVLHNWNLSENYPTPKCTLMTICHHCHLHADHAQDVANGPDPAPNSTAPPTPDWRVKEEEEKEEDADSMAINIGYETPGLLGNVEAGIHQKPRGFQQLLRRNSSPSVSMFGGVHGLHSSRERISPQAIQELLEFSRLSGGRARSPDSRISSRSSSPPCSSGRSSPAITGIVSRLKAANLLPSSSGMRKLSSSPHLLGICEESEDGSTDPLSNPFCTVRLLSKGAANNASFKTHLGGRGTRSASIGKATAFEPTPLTKFQAVTLANGLTMEVTLKRSNPSISVPAAASSSQPLSQ